MRLSVLDLSAVRCTGDDELIVVGLVSLGVGGG